MNNPQGLAHWFRPRPSRLPAVVLGAAAALSLCGAASAATLVGPLTFESAADYDNAASAPYAGPFRDVLLGGSIARTTGNPNNTLRYSSAAGTGAVTATTLYDANGSTANESTFGNITTRIDFTVGASGDSVGLFGRLPATDSKGFLANVGVVTGNDTLTLFRGADISNTGDAGTSIATATPADVLAVGQTYSLEFTQMNSGADALVLTARVFNQGDFSGTPLLETSTTTTTFTGTSGRTAGRVGIRFGDNNTTAAALTDVDNFTILDAVPEPASLGLLGVGALGLLARRRREA